MVGFVYLVFGIVSCSTSIILKNILIFTFIYVCAYAWAMYVHVQVREQLVGISL